MIVKTNNKKQETIKNKKFSPALSCSSTADMGLYILYG